MKKYFLISSNAHSYECDKKVRFKPTAFALALISACAAFVPTQTVHAQGANALEEIIVTARKREESLQETPVVVNVLTSESLSAARVEGLKDLGTIVPGLVTTESSAATSGLIFLRGIGTGSLSPLLDQAVSINVDGVGLSSASLLNAGMFDLDRIEVLRGPQALFFGKNSPGGVVAVHTKDPSDEFEFNFSAQYETEGEEPIARAVVSGPLSETLGGRLSVGWSDAGNNRFDINNFDLTEATPFGPVQTVFETDDQETEKIYALGTLVWEPSDDLTATLKMAHLEDSIDGNTTHDFQRTQCLAGPRTVRQVPGVDNCRLDGDVIGPGLQPIFTAVDPNFPGAEDAFQDNTEDFLSLQIEYAISDDLDLTSVTGYYDQELERIAESSFQVTPGLLSSVLGGIEQFSQELRLTSNYDGAVNFTVGAFYEDREIRQQQAVTVGSTFAGLPATVFGVFPAALLGQDLIVQDSTAWSVFGQVDWDITDKLALTFGARYSDEEKELELDVNNLAPAPGGGPRISIPLADDTLTFDNFSPELTLSYQYTDDVMLFASYKDGFKSGGFDAGFSGGARLLATEPADLSFQEEEAQGFEAGLKSTILDGTLRLNATLYYYEYDGLQLTSLVNNADGSVSTSVQNAASATIQGLELEALWLTPVEGLTLTANIAFNDSEYDDFLAPCFQGQTIALGCDQSFDAATGAFTAADLSGESLTNASDVSATFALDYLVPVSDNWNLGLNVTTSYTDEFNPTSLAIPESFYQDSYWLTNASVTLLSSDDKWEFFVRGINLGDEYYSATGSFFGGTNATNGTNDASGIGDFFQFINGGRQFLLGFNYRM